MSLRPILLLLPGLLLTSCSSMRSPIVPGAVPKDHGAIGATEETGSGWDDTMAAMRLVFDAPWNARRPVAIS